MSLVRSFALLGFATALSAPTASAQLGDFCLRNIEVNQIIQAGGATQMIAGRSTMVRTQLCPVPLGTPPTAIDGLMRVYVDGVEADFSPVFSDNGPLMLSNPGPIDLENEDATLNFIFIAPESDDVVVEVEVNPAGPNFVPESNLGNNIGATNSRSFIEQGVLQLAYAPIDLRPGGGATPNLPDPDLIKPGVGDNFVQGIFPGGLIDYRRIDAPSKLWTSSVSGSGFSLNSSLASDLALMSPQPDFIYGWVPGSLPYNGQALLPGVASMGNTQPIRHQRTYAHELGHNYNQFHNNTTVNLVGIDVERHLNVTENLSRIKAASAKDILAPGLLTPQAWVATLTYNNLRNHPSFDPPAPLMAGDEKAPMLLVSGVWNRASGEFALEHVVEVPGGRATPSALPGQADIELRGFHAGELTRSIPLTVRTSFDECSGCQQVESSEEHAHEDGSSDAQLDAPVELAFSVVIPARDFAGRNLDALEIIAAGAHPLERVRRDASAHAPEGRFLSPVAGGNTGSEVLVSWEASDADGEPVSTTLRYSPDGEEHFVPLLVRSNATELLVDLAELPHFRSGQGHFELLLSDGLRTTRVVSAVLEGNGAYAGVGGNAPWVEIYHPDAGFVFREGATVVLHSSGWDIEDFALGGDSISWASNMDGVLGTGRRLAVNTLSPGAHDITVTATDSAGQQTSRTHAISVTPRGLPDVDSEICSSQIGFGGPGESELSLCGELAIGGASTLALTGAPASTTAYLVVGFTFGPAAFKGGTLVTSAPDFIFTQQTMLDGTIVIPGISDIGTPPYYLQYVIDNDTLPGNFGFSNAVFVEF